MIRRPRAAGAGEASLWAAVAGSPALLALVLYCLGTVAVDSVPLWTARAERLVALGFAVFALRELFQKKGSWRAGPATAGVEGQGLARPFLIFLPLIAFLAFYTWGAYAGLFLGDHDFTNISTALNETASGRGLLATPYVRGGPGDTFLGHHFAPALFVYVPAYWLVGLAPTGSVPTHFLYGVLLWATLAWGLWLWAGILRRAVPGRFALMAAAGLALASPLWRLAGSFHFEVLVLPAAALVFGARRSVVFWGGVLLFLGVKEDMALYLFGFSVYLYISGENRSRAIRLALVCVFYFALAQGLLVWLSGADSAGGLWGAYWRDEWETRRTFMPAFLLLAALGFLPVFAPRVFLCLVLPVLVLHAASFHPWHQSFTGHYVYAVLPGLLLAWVHAARRLAGMRWGRVLFGVVLACVAWVAAMEREYPPGLLRENEDLASARELIARVPPGACVQAAMELSPHLPLSVRAFPLVPPIGHARRQEVAPYIRFADFPDCPDRYALFAPDRPRSPYYAPDHLAAMRALGETFGPPLRAGPWVLYRLP